MRTSTSLHVTRLFLHRLGESLTWRWQSFLMLSDLSNIVMTVVIDAISFVWLCDDRCNRCYYFHPKLRWPSLLYEHIDWSPWMIRSESCDLLVSFLQQYDVPIGPSFLFGLHSSAVIFFHRTFAMECLILTLDRLFDDEKYLTRWSNVTVHVIKYVRWYWGYFGCDCDILD